MPEKEALYRRETRDGVEIIVLCGVQGCCPTVEKTTDGVLIKDDFGGMVKLTNIEFATLQKVLLEG